MLVARAQAEGWLLLTVDNDFSAFGIRSFPASQ
jgi:hypothetical protein